MWYPVWRNYFIHMLYVLAAHWQNMVPVILYAYHIHRCNIMVPTVVYANHPRLCIFDQLLAPFMWYQINNKNVFILSVIIDFNVFVVYHIYFICLIFFFQLWANPGLVLIYLYSIHRAICRPSASDHSMVMRPRAEIRTRLILN